VNAHFIGRIVTSFVGSLAGRGQDSTACTGSLPDGIAIDTLRQVCASQCGSPFSRVSCTHISGWKGSGSYRLVLKTVDWTNWSLIYRNALYRPQEIPALAGLPVQPGPPEYHVYCHARGPMAPYLPEVYSCIELVPGAHYQYLLEDLEQDYRIGCSQAAILRAAAALPAVHRTLASWAADVGRDGMLRYDRAFSIALEQFAADHLQRYALSSGSGIVRKACEMLPEIGRVHRRLLERFDGPGVVIHGDYNTSNILVHRRRRGAMKLIDWEWAGVGLAHADLASLLKAAVPDVERQALAIYAGLQPQLSTAEHRLRYLWCKLERALLDASFLAAQCSAGKSAGRFSLPRYIEDSAARALDAHAELHDAGGA